MKLKYCFSVLAILLILLSSACSSDSTLSLGGGGTDSKSDAARDKSAIFIAVQPDNEPFEYIDGDGYYDGFSIALAMKLCEELGRRPIFISDYGEGLYDSLNCGVAEMCISSLTANDVTKQKVDFTSEYITLSSAIVVNAYDSVVTSVQSLSGIPSVGVVSGSLSEKYLTQRVGLDNVFEYRNISEAEAAFAEGTCYALFIDDYIAERLSRNNTSAIIRKRGIGEQKYSIAVAKGNSELVRTLNEKISRFKTDGTLLDLRKAYLADDKELRDLFSTEVKAIQN